ncbi:MAG: glycosyltransferase [Bacteroidia bacterium]|nr:glycosyltransferase [Bacteroidia bacterium]
MPFVSIIIPCRNEEKNIGPCLLSIARQKFPFSQYEIIVVDDCSEDDTLNEAKKFCAQHPQISVRIVELKENHRAKKGALTAGINVAAGELIITRDADSFSENENWLSSLTKEFENEKTAMVCAPVFINSASGFLEQFQLCENFILQVIGGGCTLLGFPFLCNGANLAFRKKLFYEVKGYEGNFETLSGDDIFLLKKFRNKFRNGIAYANSAEAAVTVNPELSLTALLAQKLRWSGKFFKTLEPTGFLTALSVFGINLLFLFLTAWSFVFGLWYKYLILGILIKWLIDFLLLFLASSRFRVWSWLYWFIPLQVMNTVYSVIIPFAVLVSKPMWKGRKT